VPVPELSVQPFARFGKETEERVPGDLARIGAARALARADRPVVLNKRRVEVEGHLLPLEQGMDAREEAVEGVVQLTDVAEIEAGEEAPEGWSGQAEDGPAAAPGPSRSA
jgi:hypothetical protein